MGLVILPGEDLDRAILRVACEHAAGAEQHLEAVAADPVASVHEARRHIRALRALVRLLRPLLRAEAARDLGEQLACAAGLLSPHRDAHVQLEALARLTQAIGAAERPEPAWLGRVLAAHLDRGLSPLEAAAAEAGVLLRGCREQLAGFAAAQDVGRLDIADALRRSAKRARKSYRSARESPRAEHLHDLRKRCKDVREQLRALIPLDPEALGALARGYDRICALLGESRDLELLRHSLEAVEAELPEAGAIVEQIRAAAELGEANLSAEAMRRARRVTRRGVRRASALLAG